MNSIRRVSCIGLLGFMACGETVTPVIDAGRDTTVTDTTVADTTVADTGVRPCGTTGPATGGPAEARTLLARGYREAEATILAGYSVDFFTNGMVTPTCAAPNCLSASVNAQGGLSASLPPNWYSYRIVDPAAPGRPCIPTYGYNRRPQGSMPDQIFQVSAATRTALMTAFSRMHAPGTGALAGASASSAGTPFVGATARFFVNGTALATGPNPTSPFVGYLSGAPNETPSPMPLLTETGPNGRFAAANMPAVAAGSLVRVELLQNGVVVACEEANVFPDSFTFLNVGPLRTDYPATSGCHPVRAVPCPAVDGGVDASSDTATDTTVGD